MPNLVRKAIIPAAGLGTRFLPVTKTGPKEMLPIVDIPVIGYVVEEAVASGIEEILIVTREGKEVIERYFTPDPDLENLLRERGKEKELENILRLADQTEISFVNQPEPLGLGHAIRCGRAFTGDEPFAVLLGDAIHDSGVPVTRQLIEVWEQFRQPVVAVEEVPDEKVDRYGIVSGHRLNDTILAIEEIVEKPDRAEAPSNLAIAGRYIFTPGIHDALDQVPVGEDGEIPLTDAIALLAARERILAYSFRGRRYDIGNRLDFITTNIVFGLKREEFAAPLRAFLAGLDPGAGEDDRGERTV
jgi:UTP--glucose-1-phosphate uridylyltransferase